MKHTASNIAPLFGDDEKLVGAVNCSQDLSAFRLAEQERVRLAEELHQAKKLETIGQIAAGIVHDFKNLLAAIHGNLELLTSRTNEGRLLVLLRNATRSVERGERLAQQLLAFARKRVLLPQAVDLNQVLVRMNDLLHTSVGSGVLIEMRKQPGLRHALVDPGEIELIVLNLVINARDAMPGGGILTIETGDVTFEAGDRPVDLPAGGYVVVSVTDTGIGMSDEVRTKAFEPFFTTKEEGKGSGLGLSMVLSVAQQSGGDVRIRSWAGEGTSIEVYLPCVQDSSSAGPASVES